MNQTLKSLKTPLRYPGGKSRATKYILPRFPDDIKEYRETFLGGGSVAIAFTKANPDIPVWVNDLYEPLYNFWRVLQDYNEELCAELVKLKQQHPEPISAKNLFLESKQLVNDYDQSHLSRACAFYVINKCSFSGLTESSSFSRQASNSNFSMRGIEKLKGYSEIIQNWKITNWSYEGLLSDDIRCFIYSDPPYDIKDNLYGNKGDLHKRFDHDQFAVDCDNHLARHMISYNSIQMVKDRFKEWLACSYDLTYTMRSTGDYMNEQKDRAELLLTNY
jgi:DNA adenine methylase